MLKRLQPGAIVLGGLLAALVVTALRQRLLVQRSKAGLEEEDEPAREWHRRM